MTARRPWPSAPATPTASSWRARPPSPPALEPHDPLTEATDIRSSAQQLGNHFVAWMVATDAVRARLVIDHLDESLRRVGRRVEDNPALGAREAPRLTEL